MAFEIVVFQLKLLWDSFKYFWNRLSVCIYEAIRYADFSGIIRSMMKKIERFPKVSARVCTKTQNSKFPLCRSTFVSFVFARYLLFKKFDDGICETRNSQANESASFFRMFFWKKTSQLFKGPQAFPAS